MAHDTLLYLRSGDATALAAAGYESTARGAWLRVAIDEPDQDRARELSARFATAAVWCLLDSIAEQIWLVAFERGEQVRELHFADRTWRQTGQLAGEARALANWLSVKELCSIPDGYDVLACVLGEDQPPVEVIDESHAAPAGWQRQALYFPSTLVAELADAAARHGAPMSRVLCAAWHLGKHALYERELAKGPSLDLESPLDPPPAGEPDPAFVKAAAPVADLAPTTRKVKCTVALPPETLAEIAAMARGLDRTLSWAMTEAYVLARPRLA
jgi:hypothetical protein